MPAALWFSLLALVYVVGMATYHGFFLVNQYVLPEPEERESPDWRSVRIELMLTVMILAPLLRHVLPTLTWVKGSRSAVAAVFYVLAFAWLPLLKGVTFVFFRPGERNARFPRLLYSAPLSVLYVLGIAYLLFVTITMMIVR